MSFWERSGTVCLRSLVHCCIVSKFILILDKTSWTFMIYQDIALQYKYETFLEFKCENGQFFSSSFSYIYVYICFITMKYKLIKINALVQKTIWIKFIFSNFYFLRKAAKKFFFVLALSPPPLLELSGHIFLGIFSSKKVFFS